MSGRGGWGGGVRGTQHCSLSSGRCRVEKTHSPLEPPGGDTAPDFSPVTPSWTPGLKNRTVSRGGFRPWSWRHLLWQHQETKTKSNLLPPVAQPSPGPFLCHHLALLISPQRRALLIKRCVFHVSHLHSKVCSSEKFSQPYSSSPGEVMTPLHTSLSTCSSPVVLA